MDRKTVLLSLLVIVVLLAGIPESFARPEYVSSLNAEYGVSSCGTCHIDPNGGGTRNAYGISFQNQPNHRANPSAALIAIGAPPNANPTVTATATPEPTVTSTPTPVGTTVTARNTPVPPAATATPAAPGFGIGLSLIGLFAWSILGKTKN